MNNIQIVKVQPQGVAQLLFDVFANFNHDVADKSVAFIKVLFIG